MLSYAKVILVLGCIIVLSRCVLMMALSDAGKGTRQRRMIKGRDADVRDWRFICYLSFHQPNPKWKICGGALLRENWIITAAHCVEDIYTKPDYVSVTVGRARRSLKDNHKRTYKVSQIIVHTKYLELIANYNATNQEYFNWDYDIALLKLTSPATNQETEIVKLPSGPLNVNRMTSFICKAAGWGSQHELSSTPVSDGSINYNPPDDLQEIDVPVKTKAHCRLFHGKEISDLVFCGGDFKKGTMTSCLGDSGSPLVCRRSMSHKPILAGIVIGGDYFCRTGSQYMMFTEVSKYRKWIDGYVKA